jgi:preprotein translocase subunit YajC
MLFLFIQDLYAAGGTAQSIGSLIVPLSLISVVMYFFMIRPQQKRANEHKTMLTSLKRGDRIVTMGGLLGSVQKIEEHNVVIDVGDGVSITILKTAISSKIERAGAVAAAAEHTAGAPVERNTNNGGGSKVSVKKSRKRTK